MLAKFGSIIIDGKGTIGGFIIQKNKAGTIVRVKKSPTQPNNPLQLNTRAYFAYCQSQYNHLTAEQINEWNIFAAKMPVTNYFGDIRFLSGQQMFMYCAMNFFNSGMQPLQNAPTDTGHPNNIQLTYFINRVSSTIVQFEDTLGPNDLLKIKITRPLRPSIHYFEDKFNLAICTRPAGGYIDGTQWYINRFGTKTEGFNIVLEWFTVSTINGQLSTINRLISTIEPD